VVFGVFFFFWFSGQGIIPKRGISFLPAGEGFFALFPHTSENRACTISIGNTSFQNEVFRSN